VLVLASVTTTAVTSTATVLVSDQVLDLVLLSELALPLLLALVTSTATALVLDQALAWVTIPAVALVLDLVLASTPPVSPVLATTDLPTDLASAQVPASDLRAVA